jgi:hypothetical protein
MCGVPSRYSVVTNLCSLIWHDRMWFFAQVRVATLAVAIVAAAGGSSYALKSATPFMHIIAFGIWLGTMVYTTFIAGL